jgi:hypothetical protein
VFKNNKKQYINILKENKQLKLNCKILQDKKIFKQNDSTFLITDDNMPKDVLFKLNTFQKEISHTYLISLFEGVNQKIIQTSNTDVIKFNSVKLSDNSSVIIAKNEVVSASKYFENSGIDYIISPFSILNEYMISKSCKNSLNVLVYNNVIYMIILDDLKQIIHSEIKSLTLLEDTQDDNFSDDEIVNQKLYEEVCFLEIQQCLKDVVEKYYEENENIDFLEKIELLYTLQSLSKEQIDSLYETIMVTIDYKQIKIEDYLTDIVQKDDAQKYNFIDIRVKKESNNIFVWLLFTIISMIIATGVLYYKLEEKTE